MRKCSKCGETKPLTEYYKQAGCKDGRRPDCKDCVKARNLAYRHADLETSRKRDRDRYPARAEIMRERARKWYADNKTRAKRSRAAYYEAEKHRWYAYRSRRHQRLTDYFVEDVYFDAILLRDLGICGICRTPILDETVELDHIIPQVAGGTHEPNNVQLAHRACNRQKWTAI